MGWDKLLETLKQRLKEQKGRHQGGSKWIGTAGTSPFGAYGYHPEGIRIGQDGNRNFRAVKVWDRREFKDFDDSVELGIRNMRIALRRLRRFARAGAPDELDLEETIHETASTRLSRRAIAPGAPQRGKGPACFSMSAARWTGMSRSPRSCFSAARLEFKHFEHFYFHNCLYERVWKENRRRQDTAMETLDIIRTYPPDYRVVFVGDASMSPYEIAVPGGSVEHWNEEAGQVWMGRLLSHFQKGGLAEPDPAEAVALHSFRSADARNPRRPHVSPHARGH